MRVVFLGKGGSGKTTTAAGFIRYLSMQGRNVLAIDADINAHLQATLGFDGKALLLGDEFTMVADYVRGDRADLASRPMIGTTPPGVGSTMVQPSANDPLMRSLALKGAGDNAGVSLLTVGGYQSEDIGANCYHGKLGALCLLLNHMIDGPLDWIVADATAGTDTAATALFHAYDIQFFVVEPTLKSVSVFNDYLALAVEPSHPIIPLANKVRTDPDGRRADLAFLDEHLLRPVMVDFPFDLHSARLMEQGHAHVQRDVVERNSAEYAQLLARACGVSRDWQSMGRQMLTSYANACVNWYNAYYGQDMVTGVGEGFDWNVHSERWASSRLESALCEPDR